MTHHFDGIEFTMKFRQKNTFMTSLEKYCAWVSFSEALWVCGHSESKFIIIFASPINDRNICNMVDTTWLKGSNSAFFQIFPILIGNFRQISGYISLYVLFLKNGSMNQAEIWPRALPN